MQSSVRLRKYKHCWNWHVSVLSQRLQVFGNFGERVVALLLWKYTTFVSTVRSRRMNGSSNRWSGEDQGSVLVLPVTTNVTFNRLLPPWASARKQRGCIVRPIWVLKYYDFTKRQDFNLFIFIFFFHFWAAAEHLHLVVELPGICVLCSISEGTGLPNASWHLGYT